MAFAVSAGMAAGADRLLGLCARAHHGAAGTEIVLDEGRLGGVGVARDRPPPRGLPAPLSVGPADGVDAVFALASKAYDSHALDTRSASCDDYVAHDAVVAGAHRAPVHVVAEIAGAQKALLHL